MTTSTPSAATSARVTSVRGLLGLVGARWPSVLGLLVLLLNTSGGAEPRPAVLIIVLAAMTYLAAASVGSRRSGWVVLGAAVVAVGVATATGIDAVAMLVLAGAGFFSYGVLRGAPAGRREVAIQGLGFVAFTATALAALTAGPVAAMVLASLAASGHGVWDVVHHVRDKVVPRSLAEFCFVLDLSLGLVLMVTAGILAE